MTWIQLNKLLEYEQFHLPNRLSGIENWSISRGTEGQRDLSALVQQLMSALQTVKMLHRIQLVGNMEEYYSYFLRLMLPLCDAGIVEAESRLDADESSSLKCDQIVNSFEATQTTIDVRLFYDLCVNFSNL